MTLATTSAALTSGTWAADASHSSIGFDIKYMLVTSIRGRIADVTAQLDSTGPELAISGTAKTASITTFDEQRDAHLHNPEFFDVERYPEATFNGTFTAPDRVEGSLTIKGTSRPVSFDATVSDTAEDPWGNTRVSVELSTTIDRRDFDLNWNAPLPGGGILVDNTVRLVANISFIRQQDNV